MLSIQKATLQEIMTEILDAAVDLTEADFGTIQLIEPATGRLKVAAKRGFSKAFVEFWDVLTMDPGACGTALNKKTRIIVEDVERSEIFAGTKSLGVLLESGVRAVQSTPLVGRTGEVLGIFSTNYRNPHRPDARTLEWLDLLARQAADLIEQHQAQAALKKRSKELARLAGELTLAEHRERRRIADHLHDNLQQLLVGARLQAQAISRSAPKKTEALLGTLVETLKDAIDATRNLSRELAPPVAINGNLPETFHWLASEVHRQHTLNVVVGIRGGFEDLPEAESIFLFSAARELLLNVVKHAGVLEAGLELCRDNEKVVLKISDKGRGYDPMAVAASKSHGLGLFSIRERLDFLGGRLAMESGLNKGTSVVLEIPVKMLAAVEKDGRGTIEVEGETGLAEKWTEKQSAGARRIRVVFVDDHRIVRESLVALLNEETDIEVVGQCENGLEAVEQADRLKPDVFVMDGNMPVMNGIEATRDIKKRWPGIKVIGLSMMEEREGGVKMRAAGADGYVSKSGPPEELVDAIRGCCSGGG
jgi:signal transduction histidine kinase/CheY-like chemotaxis protein